jgi:hypothetical protein
MSVTGPLVYIGMWVISWVIVPNPCANEHIRSIIQNHPQDKTEIIFQKIILEFSDLL